MYTKNKSSSSSCSIFLLIFPVFFLLGSCHWIDLHNWYDHVVTSLPPPTSANGNYNNDDGGGRLGPTTLAATNSNHHNGSMTKTKAGGGGSDPIVVMNSLTTSAQGEEGKPEEKKLPGCRELTGLLSESQIHICQLFNDHMSPLVQAAKLGLQECRWQFRYNQWNCSAPHELSSSSSSTVTPSSSISSKSSSSAKWTSFVPTSGSGSSTVGKASANVNKAHTGYNNKAFPSDSSSSSSSSVDWNAILTRGSKEVALVHALLSAAVIQSVSRSCRDGSLTSCGCGKTNRPSELKSEWRWGGCGDNLQYGYKFSQNFVDSREQERNLHYSTSSVYDKREKSKVLANLHNNEAGRRSVLKKTKIACKCHGVSGSCAIVTCWHQVPSFREIGSHLKERYARATLVKLNKRGRLQVKRAGDPVPSVYDLVYVESSPNYCHRNDSVGVFGTSGRVCNRTATAPDSCKNLCCNRSYTQVVVKSAKRCKCRFIWCCTVECQQCSKIQKYDVCK